MWEGAAGTSSGHNSAFKLQMCVFVCVVRVRS